MKRTVCYVILYTIFIFLFGSVIFPLFEWEFEPMAFWAVFTLGNITAIISQDI